MAFIIFINFTGKSFKMKKGFSNIRNKINSLLISNKCYVSISPSKKLSFEKITIRLRLTYGKKILLNERRNFK